MISTDEEVRRLRRLLEADGADRRSVWRYMTLLARIYGANPLTSLTDRALWSGAAAGAQDEAFFVVARILGPAWDFVGAEGYTAAPGDRIGRFHHRPTGLELHLIPGGPAALGARQANRGYKVMPPRRIQLPPLLVGRTPVSQEQWDRVGGEDARKWRGADLPIEGVSWKDARDWCLRAGDGLRLPSESEWEYAARAGSDDRYPWGRDFDPSYVWYKTNSRSRTHAAEEHADRANAFGLIDVLGNVMEWCQDRFDLQPERVPENGGAVGDGRGTYRVKRGGSWCCYQNDIESAYRSQYPRWKRTSTVGFRVVRSLELPGGPFGPE